LSHIKNIKIENFRKLKSIELKDTKDINILIGENNSGKTSILESIMFLEYPNDINRLILLYKIREVLKNNEKTSWYKSFINMFNKEFDKKNISFSAEIGNKKIQINIDGHEEYLFRLTDEELPISVFSGKYKFIIDNKQYEKKFSLREDDYEILYKDNNLLIPMKYISPIDHYMQKRYVEYISKSIKLGKKQDILEMMKIFDKNIDGFDLITENNITSLYINHKINGILPISAFGDGIKKAITISSAVIEAIDGILLIDEIETAIHARALKDFFKWLMEICKRYNTQIFLTTHSIEAIDALIEGGIDYIADIACYRLESDNYDTYVNRFSGEQLYSIRSNMGLDVR
jgi:AAA15 family ATPase/GTPase